MGVHNMKLNTSIVEGHELSEIARHIDKVVNINFQCKARPTALHAAVLHNNVQVAALLLRRGADMMMPPLKKSARDESECTLLTAFKLAESHEKMQDLLLRHLSGCSREHLDSVSLKNIVRVAQYAMLYCSARVFFAAEEVKKKLLVVNPMWFNPLMYTIVQVGLYEENVDKCAMIFDRVVQILDRDSTMLWQRYYCLNVAKRGSLPAFTGGTALGMLLFYVLAGRQKRCTEYAGYLAGVERGKARMAQYMPATDPHHDGLVQFGIERDAKHKGIHKKNLAIMQHLGNEVAPCLFAKMLPPMRVALGMATHGRLGNQDKCGVGLLNVDIMNMIFNQLVRGIVTSPEEYQYMLF